MSVQGLDLKPGIRETWGPSEILSYLALTKVARLQKDYTLSGYVSQRPTLLLGDSEKEWKRYWE
jgi:hypothetical protein